MQKGTQFWQTQDIALFSRFTNVVVFRSYTDFLLVSFVMFHYGLPLPAIAAGMDFKVIFQNK